MIDIIHKNIKMQIFVFLEQVGAGKSFYTKLLILRNRLLRIEQYIIDPDREYGSLSNAYDATMIKIGPNSETYINIFDIRQESIEDDEGGYLANKIGKLNGFFNLIFGNLDEEEKAILEEKIIELYDLKGITFEDETIYVFDLMETEIFLDIKGKRAKKDTESQSTTESANNIEETVSSNTDNERSAEEIKRKNRIPFYPKEWKDSFGLPVEEHRKALEINMLDGYAEFTTGK